LGARTIVPEELAKISGVTKPKVAPTPKAVKPANTNK
jgi:hypothetical protein